MNLDFLIQNFSYLAIFFLMLLNGVINFPSSQLLYLLCGYFASVGNLILLPTIIAGATGNTLGNMITYSLAKKYGEDFARKILFLDEKTFSKIHNALKITFSKNGMWYIFFGKITPSVKAFIPILAGLSLTRTKITFLIFFISSFIWATALIYMGYFFGKHITLTEFSFVSLFIGIIIITLMYKKIKKALPR